MSWPPNSSGSLLTPLNLPDPANETQRFLANHSLSFRGDADNHALPLPYLTRYPNRNQNQNQADLHPHPNQTPANIRPLTPLLDPYQITTSGYPIGNGFFFFPDDADDDANDDNNDDDAMSSLAQEEDLAAAVSLVRDAIHGANSLGLDPAVVMVELGRGAAAGGSSSSRTTPSPRTQQRRARGHRVSRAAGEAVIYEGVRFVLFLFVP